MKKTPLMDILFCVLPVVILMVAFSFSASIGQSDIFGVGGMLRYIWVMWLFAPLFLLPIGYGFRKKKRFEPYVRYFVISTITLSFLLLFGSYRFIFSDMFDYTTGHLSYIEGFSDVDIPDDVKMVTEHHDEMPGFDPYYISRINITDSAEAVAFEKTLGRDERWIVQLPTAVKGLLPSFHQLELEPYDYFLFYNLTTDTYNTFPTVDYNNCILLAYDAERNCFYVIHDLVVRPVF